MTNTKLKIKKGDDVIVIAGKEKGKTGKIIRVIPKESRVVVGGLNMVKRHTKASQASAGGLVAKESPLHVSNVSLVDPKSGKATRVSYKTTDEGRKVRIAKRSGETING